MNGVELIARERHRQISVEGWDAAHDAAHASGELASAAVCYATVVPKRATRGNNRPPPNWPWDKKWWKPKSDGHANNLCRVADLVRAGALIAAEIDRLQALGKEQP